MKRFVCAIGIVSVVAGVFLLIHYREFSNVGVDVVTGIELSENRTGTSSSGTEDIRENMIEDSLASSSDELVVLEEAGAVFSKVMAAEPCDESATSTELVKLLDYISPNKAVWTIEEPLRVTRQEGEFGWVEVKSGVIPISPCESMVMFVTENSNEADITERNVHDWLARNAWVSNAAQTIGSESTSKSVSISLAHADGPMGGTVVYSRPLRDKHLMEFFAISVMDSREHWAEYIAGEREDFCPCSYSITLRHSFPVSFAPYLE